MFSRIGFLKKSQNSQENTFAGVSFLWSWRPCACNVMKKRPPAKVFSYEFCKTLKRNFYTQHFRVIASEYCFCLLSDCIGYCPALWSWIAFIVKIKHMKHVRGSCVWCTPGKFILTFKCVLSKSYIEFVTKFTLRLALPISTLIMKIFHVWTYFWPMFYTP